MKTRSKKSAVNFGSAVLYKIIVIIVGLLLPRLLITSYGSEINGLQSSVRQIFNYIALLEAGVGAATIQSLFGPVVNGNKEKINAYMSAAAAYYNKIGVIYFAALVVMAAIYSIAVPVESMAQRWVFVYVIVSGALTGINFFYFAKLKLLISAEGDQYIVSTMTMVTYLISSALKIAFIYAGFNIIAVECAYLAVNLLATAVYYLIAKRKYPWLDFKVKPDYAGMEQKNSVMVHKISSLVFQNIDILLLTFFCSLETVSIYSMYKMVVNMVTSIVSEVGNSVNFVFGQKFNEKEDKTEYISLIDTFNVYYSAIAFGLYTVTYILLLPFLELYTDGLDINYIYEWMPVLYIVIEFLTVGREAMVRTIDVAGHFKKTQWRTVAETLLNLIGSVVFIIIFRNVFGEIGGIYGALMGTVLAMLYRTIDINIYANKNVLKRGFMKSFRPMAVNAVLFIIVATVFEKIDLVIESYFDFVVAGLWITPIILGLFLTIHLLLNIQEFEYSKAYIKAKILKKR